MESTSRAGARRGARINKGAPSHTSIFWGSTDIQNLFDGGVQIFRTIALCTHSAAAAHFFRWFSDPQARCVLWVEGYPARMLARCIRSFWVAHSLSCTFFCPPVFHGAINKQCSRRSGQCMCYNRLHLYLRRILGKFP